MWIKGSSSLPLHCVTVISTSLKEFPISQKKHRFHIPVHAFMKVDKDLFNILKNGSLHGYFFEPHSVVCSRMCGTPVLSIGVVRNVTLQNKTCIIAVIVKE